MSKLARPVNVGLGRIDELSPRRGKRNWHQSGPIELKEWIGSDAWGWFGVSARECDVGQTRQNTDVDQCWSNLITEEKWAKRYKTGMLINLINVDHPIFKKRVLAQFNICWGASMNVAEDPARNLGREEGVGNTAAPCFKSSFV